MRPGTRSQGRRALSTTDTFVLLCSRECKDAALRRAPRGGARADPAQEASLRTRVPALWTLQPGSVFLSRVDVHVQLRMRVFNTERKRRLPDSPLLVFTPESFKGPWTSQATVDAPGPQALHPQHQSAPVPTLEHPGEACVLPGSRDRCPPNLLSYLDALPPPPPRRPLSRPLPEHADLPPPSTATTSLPVRLRRPRSW